jgi:hypothetical protein
VTEACRAATNVCEHGAGRSLWVWAEMGEQEGYPAASTMGAMCRTIVLQRHGSQLSRS